MIRCVVDIEFSSLITDAASYNDNDDDDDDDGEDAGIDDNDGRDGN